MSLSSLSKMTTSESEQGMIDSDKSMNGSIDSNGTSYFFEHASDDQQVPDCQNEDDDDHHRKSSFKKETPVMHHKDVEPCDTHYLVEDDFGRFDDYALDDYHDDEMIGCRKHSLTYSKEDIDQLMTKAERMVFNHSKTSSDQMKEDDCEASGESDEEVTQRWTLPPFQPISTRRKSQISARKVSLKEVSTIDSNVNKSWRDTDSQQGESRTWDVKHLREKNNPLNDISSGEMSSHDSEGRKSRLSNVISDLWDEENYLSEHNYDEPLEEDKARKLLNFGDDYRNFMDSMSGSQTSLNDTLTKSSKRCRKKSRKKQVVSELSNASHSDNELEEVCKIIADSHKKLKNVEKLATEFFVDGFIKKENLKEYHGLVQTCSEYLKHLIHLLQSVELDDSFVSKKKSREIRILVSCWENLLRKIKENIELTSVYEKLGNDISSFRHDLVSLMQHRNTSSMSNKSEDLTEKLKQYMETMEELSNFKTRLFGLNLGVHNFLATLSCSQMVDENQVTLAIHLKEEVVEMYALWDKSHQQTTEDISTAEEAMRKYNHFQEELKQLKRILDQDAHHIKKNCGKKSRRKSGKHSSGDSGISDSGGGFSDADIPQREQHLTQLRILAKDLEQDFSPGSPALEVISETLETTSSQLEDLQNTYQKYKKAQRIQRIEKKQEQLKKEKRQDQIEKEEGQKQLSEIIDNQEEKDSQQEYSSFSRKFRVGKIAAMMSFGFVCLVFMSWMSQPDCCEAINNLAFTTQFRYVNGPPPI